MKKITQETQVVDAIRENGGYSTLKRLYEVIDSSSWKTKTPNESIRRIVQQSPRIFKIQPGLWTLQQCRDEVLRKFELKIGNKQSEEIFSHGYYQGLLIEIGKLQNFTTYIPPQDKHKKFIEQYLGDLTDTTELPNFTYQNLLRRAKTIDVIWFNERNMPSDFYEVEHTTDIKNSLSKFYELQDFYANFYIVANAHRKQEFEDKLNVSIYSPIAKRVKFLDYERVSSMYEGILKVKKFNW